jgi:cell division protease FtsH
LSFGPKEEQIFLGREIAQHRDYSERTAELIDREVRRVVDEAGDRAEKLIAENVDKLKALANALLDREILDREEIDRILEGRELGTPAAQPAEETAQETPHAESAGSESGEVSAADDEKRE